MNADQERDLENVQRLTRKAMEEQGPDARAVMLALVMVVPQDNGGEKIAVGIVSQVAPADARRIVPNVARAVHAYAAATDEVQ